MILEAVIAVDIPETWEAEERVNSDGQSLADAIREDISNNTAAAVLPCLLDDELGFDQNNRIVLRVSSIDDREPMTTAQLKEVDRWVRSERDATYARERHNYKGYK